MLIRITDALLAAGLLDRGDPHIVDISLTTGHCVHLHIHSEKNRYWHIKASEALNLEPEFERFKQAYATLENFTPKPITYVSLPGCNFIVAAGIASRPVRVRDLISRGELTRHGLQFVEILRRMAAIERGVESRSHERLLKIVQHHLSGTGLEVQLDSWKTEFGALVEKLPVRQQHGDFTLNNLAVHNGHLVLFDFEDYGRIRLGGLDLAVWYASATNFDTRRLRSLFRCGSIEHDEFGPLLSAACNALGISPQVFAQMLPLYLMIFLMLKANYSASIRRIVGSAVKEILV